MKTPKEKAIELVEIFSCIRQKSTDKITSQLIYDEAKQCALICVDEIESKPYDIYIVAQCGNVVRYWDKVKQEIEKT
jgi:hypothetical protein